MSSPLIYLVMLNIKNQPIFFTFFGQKPLKDELNFQMHCYSALDFFKQRIEQRKNEYLGLLSTIYSVDGDYDIYGYYSLTKVKIMMVLKQKPDQSKYDQTTISKFLRQIYQRYQAELLNPFGDSLKSGKMEPKFYEKIGIMGQNFYPK